MEVSKQDVNISPDKPPDEQEDTSAKPTLEIVRKIDYLPLPPLTNFSPHTRLDFDCSVQEYCQNRNNHIQTAQCYQYEKAPIASNDKDPKPPSRAYNLLSNAFGPTAKLRAFNSVNAPFTRIVRSCKVIVSGDVCVGKTCLVNRFSHDVYSNQYQTTIGVDFDLQKFSVLGQPFVLQLWDTAGLERFRCITNSYYRGCQAALLVFDTSNLSTLANVIKWRDEVINSSKSFEQNVYEDSCANLKTNLSLSRAFKGAPLLFLVGTKWDLPLSDSSRSFISEEANKIAALLQAELWFVSAQTGENVTELFHRIAALSFQNIINSEIHRIRFDASTLGANIKEKLIQQRKDLWCQSSKLIKITKKKDGDDKRTKCINVHCVIK